MASSSLSVTPASGSQTPVTQSSLQASGQASLDNGLSGKVQSGIAGEQLKSDQGISLAPAALSTVDLNATSSQPTTITPVKTHHFNPILTSIVVILVIAAVVMVKFINDSSKKHNQY
jgi:hypothetical protein